MIRNYFSKVWMSMLHASIESKCGLMVSGLREQQSLEIFSLSKSRNKDSEIDKQVGYLDSTRLYAACSYEVETYS